MGNEMSRRVVVAATIMLGTVLVDARAQEGAKVSQNGMSAPSGIAAGRKIRSSRLGAINVPYDHFQWYVDHGYDFMAKIHGGPEGAADNVHEILEAKGIEYFTYGQGDMKIKDMREEDVPAERRGLKRGPGAN